MGSIENILFRQRPKAELQVRKAHELIRVWEDKIKKIFLRNPANTPTKMTRYYIQIRELFYNFIIFLKENLAFVGFLFAPPTL